MEDTMKLAVVVFLLLLAFAFGYVTTWVTTALTAPEGMAAHRPARRRATLPPRVGAFV